MRTLSSSTHSTITPKIVTTTVTRRRNRKKTTPTISNTRGTPMSEQSQEISTERKDRGWFDSLFGDTDAEEIDDYEAITHASDDNVGDSTSTSKIPQGTAVAKVPSQIVM